MRNLNFCLQYEPVFTTGNEQFVHHMILYECTSSDSEKEKSFEELSKLDGHPCYKASMSQLLFACNHVVVVWAVGSRVSAVPIYLFFNCLLLAQ